MVGQRNPMKGDARCQLCFSDFVLRSIACGFSGCFSIETAFLVQSDTGFSRCRSGLCCHRCCTMRVRKRVHEKHEDSSERTELG